MKYFLDSDGVFADFDRHSTNVLGTHPKLIGDEKFWKLAKDHPTFWESMILMDGAKEFWQAILHLQPTVLTGAPKSDFERAKIAKIKWWKETFNHEDVIVCLSRDKGTYATPESILIDDMSKNCRRFEKAGGQAILFKNYEQVIAELKEMGLL